MPTRAPVRYLALTGRTTALWRIVAAMAVLSSAQPVRAPLSAQNTGIAVERRLARELGVRVGDTLGIGSAVDSVQTQVVVDAIYEARPDPSGVIRPERTVRLHLPDLARLLGAPDRVDRFGVGLEPGTDPGRASAAPNRAAFGFRALPSATVAAGSSQTFLVVSRFHRAIAVITIVAGAIFLLCIMLLKVEERRLDAAVMRFVGVRRRVVFLALLLEASLVALAGSVIGVGIALAGRTITNAYYQHLFDTALVFSLVTPRIVLFSVALSLGLGLGAGALAAWRLVRTPPSALWGRA